MKITTDKLIATLRAGIAGHNALTEAFPDTTALRLFNGKPDGLAGVVLERFGNTLFVQYHEDRQHVGITQLHDAISTIRDDLSVSAVYLKQFVRDRAADADAVHSLHHESDPWIGNAAPEEFAITENGIQLLVRPYDGYSVGLFLEHRDNRATIRARAAGKHVLNLYAYTCGFSVAAAAGGAAEITSVDISPRYLDWGRRNFAANQLDVDAHRFIRSDAEEFLARARRQDRDYDLIVIDPPTFARLRRPKRTFKLDDQLEPLIAAAVDRLRPGGQLLFATNQRSINMKRIDAALHNADRSRRVKKIERPPLPADFAGDPDYSKTVIAHYD